MASMNFDYEKKPVLAKAVTAEPSRSVTRKPTATHDSDDFDESQIEPRKCRYSPSVLVGNWFDRRVDYKPPADHWITVYDSTYTCKKNLEFKKDRKSSKEHKTQAGGLGSEFLLEHYGRAFYDNYTTTNDVFYRVIPLGLCGPRRRKYSSRKDVWVPQIDLSNNFGNVTDFGLSQAVECENRVTSKPSPRASIQATSYKRPVTTPAERISKPKGSFNEPRLEHLDIDVDKPFRRHFKT